MAEALWRSLTVRPEADAFVGDTPQLFGPVVFGGQLVGQAVFAAGLTVPPDRRIHSLHAYFLRPARTGVPLLHRVTAVRDGRAFAVRRLETSQEGTTVFEMACSFTAGEGDAAGEPGLAESVPGPDGLPPASWRGPWEGSRLGPEPPAGNGHPSTSRAWFRVAADLPDDARGHDAVVGLMTDMTAGGGDPVPGFSPRQMISIDHAVWFHRPLRADRWVYYDVHSLIHTGSRAVIRGAMYGPDRRLALSMAQEVLLRDAPRS